MRERFAYFCDLRLPRVESALELVEREVHVVPAARGRGEHQLVLGAEPQHLLGAHDDLARADPHREALEVLGAGGVREAGEQLAEAA